MAAEGVNRSVFGFDFVELDWTDSLVADLERSRLDALTEGGATKREGAGSRCVGMLLDDVGMAALLL